MDRNKSCTLKHNRNGAYEKRVSFSLFCSNEKQKRSANKIFAKHQLTLYILPSSKDLKAKFIN